ncbi:BAQ_1a_G0003480.mRNA.1.CDS.1 [Saccharomyces cerevisiae]|nr:BAQ_1a_G0003480.mRNA.1.CDS.1 [Saccharomyces cerevisiae]CAI4271478.1 BAM_G0003460.mRNA.1.CDS.1 [Saccharomyces cerevisiae]CAI7045945.1 BAM_G0003460.mRNA.1.CDS.1 [Saccharomyces cerevisiae]CAI7047000.1 BAQ_1a_G0003480.mRNA.1.CDS.1 [Saccharomyces cerevisiae]
MHSRKSKSITGKRKQVGSNVTRVIKPQKTRRIIRRFHHLINKRQSICKFLCLKENLDDSNEEKNDKIIRLSIKGNVRLGKYYEDGKSQSFNDAMESQLLRLHSLIKNESKSKDTSDLAVMYTLLGYIMNQINKLGGLETYQIASQNGQLKERGGDTSKLLEKWIRSSFENCPGAVALEIGSLSSGNRISRCALFRNVVRIDLEEHEGVIKQDFMERPLPRNENDKFDLISCSLVLNFVKNHRDRGAMCHRMVKFLKPQGYIFIVLPQACVTHSRYCDKTLLQNLLGSIGLIMLNSHQSNKLYYCLYQLQVVPPQPSSFFKRIKVNDGPGLNNFGITL